MGFFDTILSIPNQIVKGVTGSSLTGEYREAPMSEAGKYLYDATRGLYDQAGTLPTQKVRFGGNTFEVMPKAEKDRIGLQVAILNGLKSMQQNQTMDPGLLGRLAPALGIAAGSGLLKGDKKTSGGGGLWDQIINAITGSSAYSGAGASGFPSAGIGETEDWGNLLSL